MKNFENMKKIEILEETIKYAKKEIEEIQNDCKHIKTKLKPINGNPQDIRQSCIECGCPVGYPTKQKLDEYMQK